MTLKTYFAWFLALLLALCCLSACAAQPAETPTLPSQTPTLPTQASTDEPVLSTEDTADGQQEPFADFTATLSNGETFSLSAALAEGKPVVINLWATWCGYCVWEFPFLQEVYDQEGDRFTLVALSVDPWDTDEAIRGFAEENGLSFPMGSAVGTGLEQYASDGIPTTLILDRYGSLVVYDVGAFSSAEEFRAALADYLG